LNILDFKNPVETVQNLHLVLSSLVDIQGRTRPTRTVYQGLVFHLDLQLKSAVKKEEELVRRYPYSNLSMLKQRDGTSASVIGIWSGICSVLLCTSGELPTAKLEEEQKLLAYALAHCTNQGKFNKFNSND
jgi:hypothetical protein